MKTIHDLNIKEVLIDKEFGRFSVVFENKKQLECCLVSTGSIDGDVQYVDQVDESDNGFDWGICSEVNSWAVEEGLADWWDINLFLMSEAKKAGIEII